MARWRLSFVVAALVLCSTALGKVIQLSKGNFENHVKRTEFLVVSFCMPWYEPCQALTPELEAAAEVLSSRNIFISTIDCDKDVEICSEHDIQSYPTIRIFHTPYRAPTRYRGKQKARDIASHMIKQVLPPISEIDATNLEEFKYLDTPLLIAHFDADDKITFQTFLQVAESPLHDSFLFGTSIAESLFQTEVLERQYIELWNPVDEVPAVYYGNFDVESVIRFAEDAIASPLIPKFGMQKFAEYAQSGLPLALIFALTQSERTSLSKALKGIAVNNKRAINFVTVDAVKLPFLAEPLGLDGKTYPAFVVHDIENDETFVFDQGKDITAKGVEEFLDGFWKQGRKGGEAKETGMKSDSHDEL
ncbi:thioredoxin-like protein [Acephala macrosclerotiorum]|nr:thioredoxin-like protein [Acephala macrosclerotiorum]